MTDAATCTKIIYQSRRRYACGNKAILGTNPPRCGIHCNEAVAKRQAKRDAIYETYKAKLARQDAIRIAEQKVINAARRFAIEYRKYESDEDWGGFTLHEVELLVATVNELEAADD